MKVSEMIVKIDSIRSIMKAINIIEEHTTDANESDSLSDAVHYLGEYVQALMNREVER